MREQGRPTRSRPIPHDPVAQPEEVVGVPLHGLEHELCAPAPPTGVGGELASFTWLGRRPGAQRLIAQQRTRLRSPPLASPGARAGEPAEGGMEMLRLRRRITPNNPMLVPGYLELAGVRRGHAGRRIGRHWPDPGEEPEAPKGFCRTRGDGCLTEVFSGQTPCKASVASNPLKRLLQIPTRGELLLLSPHLNAPGSRR
jgi:hypothetical protein